MPNTLFSSMNISSAGMAAQRARLDVVAENIANAESTRTEAGGPYRRRQVIFQTIPISGQAPSFGSVFQSTMKNQASFQSVHVLKVIEDQSPFREVYDPSHPDADASGMVKMPNVNTVKEMVDMNSAARGFESNVTVMEASKRMFLKSLELLR
ncbi:MAG: flagellar basal body rod protein FlgC [Zetaproteobacteria bacterium]|nr:flagellar basal body rod protein FlgC [Zetaproteobacteria bacterium]MDQ6952231.1 flagellar basal body rod protein FlgC [Mariprofundaceae bacterium]